MTTKDNKTSPVQELPEHLRDITVVWYDPEVLDSAIAKRVQERLPGVPWKEASDGRVEHEGEGQALYLKQYKGEFLRFCPGTRYYHCCGYRIIHIGENCPLDCSYCILQAYFQDSVLKVWANTDDLFEELDKTLSADPNKRYRAGTGEFTDSLVLEAVTGLSGDLIGFLSGYDNICLELKSKVIDLSWMDKARPDRILPAWSMNAPEITTHEEHGASTLEERLQAARTCAQAGFRVCLHFDPIIRFPGWEKGYTRTIEMILDYLKPEEIAYISLGSFRHMPDLKRIIQENHPETTYIYDEFITGLDGKERLLRPLRVEQFRFMADRLRKGGIDEQLYFCMESSAVWQAVLGRTPKDIGGLGPYLMKRVFGD